MASWWSTTGLADFAAEGWVSDLRMLYVDTPPANAAAAANLDNVDEVTADEISVGGYSRMTLAGEVITLDAANDRVILDATDPSAQTLAAGATIAGAWVFRQVTNDADSKLWTFLESTDLATNGGQVTPNFNALGISTMA